MKVAIVHDDLVQYGGAEKVLSVISNIYPDAPIYTLAYNKNNKLLADKFNQKTVFTSFLQIIPFWKQIYKISFFLHPLAFEQFDFSKYDLVISQTTRFAKSVITKPGTKHISYIHTPPRFLWNFNNTESGFLNIIKSKLRIYDRVTSNRVDYFIAGSMNACSRIKKIYKKDSKVVYPFVDLKNTNYEIFDGNYYLIISRLVNYKMVKVAVEAFNKNNRNLKIIGTGPELENLKKSAKNNIEFFENISEELLFNLISGCRALIVVGEEDFGITPLEAQSLGKPVIAYRQGGLLETVIENKTGVFFDHQDTKYLNQSIEKFEKLNFKSEEIKKHVIKFSKLKFEENFKQTIESFIKNG